MKLSALLEDIKYEILAGGRDGLDTEVSEIILDSRKAEEGCLFVCIKGAVADGHKFAPDVAAKGAAVIVVEDESALENIQGPVVIKSPDTRLALACISAAWFGHPARELKTIGITGTKGKTTTTYMVKSILENVGFTIDIAVNGVEAVEKMERSPAGTYDVILMDIQMPVMDGYEAARRIRQMEDRKKAEIPIVAVTANAFEEDRIIALEAGMNGHLAKPYDISAIMKTLSELLK